MRVWQTAWAFLITWMGVPGLAAAADGSWTDSRFALPVFLVGAVLMVLIERGMARAKRLGVLLWLTVVTAVGAHAVFSQAGAFKVVWQLVAFLIGIAVFVMAAERARQRIH